MILRGTVAGTDYEFKPPWFLPVLRENTCHTELASFSEYLLHIRFNLYTTVQAGSEEAWHRVVNLETTKLYFRISDTQLVNTMFDRDLIKKCSQFINFNTYLWGSSTKTVGGLVEEDEEEAADKEPERKEDV